MASKAALEAFKNAPTVSGNFYEDYPQLREVFKPGRTLTPAQYEAALLNADLPYNAFERYDFLASKYPRVAEAERAQDLEERAAFNRIFRQPWENAPRRGTAMSDYGGVYFGVPGVSPSSMPVPEGGWEAYQRNVSQTPGAGLMAIGIDPRDPKAEEKAQAWLDFNRRRGTGLWQEGAWGSSYGRQDARMPGYTALAKKNLSAMDIADTLLRGHYGQSALKKRTADIGDFLIPAGEILLGAVTGAPWASMALGGGYGAANQGGWGALLGAAAGAGAGGFGADWASQGLSGAISNQIPDVSGVFSGGASLPSVPTTPAGVASSAADVINTIPSSFFPSQGGNQGFTGAIPTAAFGAQLSGALSPGQSSQPSKPPTSKPTEVRPSNPFNLSPDILENLKRTYGLNFAEGGFVDPNEEMGNILDSEQFHGYAEGGDVSIEDLLRLPPERERPSREESIYDMMRRLGLDENEAVVRAIAEPSLEVRPTLDAIQMMQMRHESARNARIMSEARRLGLNINGVEPYAIIDPVHKMAQQYGVTLKKEIPGMTAFVDKGYAPEADMDILVAGLAKELNDRARLQAMFNRVKGPHGGDIGGMLTYSKEF